MQTLVRDMEARKFSHVLTGYLDRREKERLKGNIGSSPELWDRTHGKS